MERRLNNFLWCLSPFVIVVLLQLVASLMAGEFAAAWMIHGFHGSSFREYMEMITSEEGVTLITFLTELIYTVSCIALFTVLYRYYFYGKNARNRDAVIAKGRPLSVSLKGYKLLPLLFGTVLFLLGLTVVCDYIVEAVSVISPKTLEDFLELEELAGLSDEVTVGTFVYVVLLGPIAEELTFRGMTFEYARRAVTFRTANIVQALLFAAMHMNAMQGIYTFVVGLCFGYIYYISGNMLLPCILHILYNALQLYASEYLSFGDTPLTLFFGVVLSLSFAYAGLLLIRRSVPTEA